MTATTKYAIDNRLAGLRAAFLKFAATATAAVTVLLAGANAEAATILYQQNFNSYATGDLHGKDNWNTFDGPLSFDVVNTITQGGFSGNAVAGGGQSQRPNSLVIPDNALISVEFDMRGSTAGSAMVGLATTGFVGATGAGAPQPAFAIGNWGNTTQGWRLREAVTGNSTSTTNSVSFEGTPLYDGSGTFHWRVKLEVDFAAFGGDASGSLYVMDLDPDDGVAGPSTYMAVPGVQNINLNFLNVNPANNITASQLTQVYIRTAGNGAIDNFVITLIPEPSAFALLGAGMLGCLALRRRRM